MTSSAGESDERAGEVSDDEGDAEEGGEAGDGGGTPSEDGRCGSAGEDGER